MCCAKTSSRAEWQVAEQEWQLAVSSLHQLSLVLLLGTQISAITTGDWARGREIHPCSKLPQRDLLPHVNSNRKLKLFYSSLESWTKCSFLNALKNVSFQTLQMLHNILIFENWTPCPVFSLLVILGSSEPHVVCTCPVLSHRMGIPSHRSTHEGSQSLFRPMC